MSADDTAYAWLNGNPLNGGLEFPGKQNSAEIICVSVDMAYINPSGTNVLAVYNPNTITGFVWASWVLDITCFDGSHMYQTNEGTNVAMYNQPTSTDPAPAVDGGGRPWYHPAYTGAAAWITPVAVTFPDALYYSPAIYPPTGLPLRPASYVSTAGNHPGNADASPAGQALYFRQTFSFLQPVSIVKTINKTSFALNETITYCFNYSNPEPVARTFTLWDTIPGVTDFIGCNNGCTTQTYGTDVVVRWTINVPASGSGSVCMWVGANRYPLIKDKNEEKEIGKDGKGIFALMRNSSENEKYALSARRSGLRGQGMMP